jgi:ABC-type Fe3+/spermidine/putrescine transport system ATPase subunit
VARIELDGVSRTYGGVVALRDVRLLIPEGEFLTLLGASGCGKTTALRIVAGFIAPTAGHLRMNGEDVTYSPPHRRNVGMVFQDYALFPHLTVAENIGFGLRARGADRAAIAGRVRQLLQLVQMEEYAGRRPAQLSGGQQQRVALARAIAHPPSVLLMDEPFSALDQELRENLQRELRTIQRSLGITTLFVTHDKAEALSLSDRIALIADGAVVQVDTPEAVYRHPVSCLAAGFLGRVNFLAGCIAGTDSEWSIVRAGESTVLVPVTTSQGDVTVGVRPGHLRVVPMNGSGNRAPPVNRLAGRVAGRTYQGDRVRLEVAVGDALWLADVTVSGHRHADGEQVWVEWDYADGMVLRR